MRYLVGGCLVLAACGGGSTGGGPVTGPSRHPETLSLARGGDQTVAAGTRLPGQIVVAVSDSRGTLPGVTVTFTAAPGSGAVDQSTAVTNDRGEAAVSWTAGQGVGQQTVTASVSPLAPLPINANVVAGPLASVTAVAGNNQAAVVGQPVPVRPVALAADQFGNPIAGLTMTFSIGTGGGALTGATPTTDAAGRATLGSWSLGPRAVTNHLFAETGGIATGFDATGTPAAVVAVTPVDQSANAGTAVAALPVVEARDPSGRPMDGVAIDFIITAGAGQISGATAVTDAAGRAHPSAWILGQTPGQNLLEARTPGLASPATFRADGIAAVPVAMTPVVGNGQQGFTGNITGQRPTVRVTDALGKPVSGKSVTFELLSGGGRIASTAAATDPRGEASLGGWRLGAATGINQVRAVTAGLAPAVFSATAVAAPAPAFQIDLRFEVGVSPAQQTAFTAAAAHWSRLILGDQADVPVKFAADPSGCYPALNETVDDLTIFVYVEALDGVGGILGAAGPCLARDDNFLPVVGAMIIDQADLADLERRGQLEAVITHEMGHVLGFGPLLWDLKSLITGVGTSEPLFLGPSAAGAYSLLAGPTSVFSKPAVPLENTGGGGTRNSHWRETVFDSELMTGFINDGTNPLSALTAASLRDIGYLVDDTIADDYSFIAALRAASSPPSAPPHTTAWPGPLRLLGRDGRLLRTVR